MSNFSDEMKKLRYLDRIMDVQFKLGVDYKFCEDDVRLYRRIYKQQLKQCQYYYKILELMQLRCSLYKKGLEFCDMRFRNLADMVFQKIKELKINE